MSMMQYEVLELIINMRVHNDLLHSSNSDISQVFVETLILKSQFGLLLNLWRSSSIIEIPQIPFLLVVSITSCVSLTQNASQQLPNSLILQERPFVVLEVSFVFVFLVI